MDLRLLRSRGYISSLVATLMLHLVSDIFLYNINHSFLFTAEFIIDLSEKHSTYESFKKVLLENGAEFSDSFIANLLRIIQHMKPTKSQPLDLPIKTAQDSLSIKFPGLALPNKDPVKIEIDQKPQKTEDKVIDDAMAELEALAPSVSGLNETKPPKREKRSRSREKRSRSPEKHNRNREIRSRSRERRSRSRKRSHSRSRDTRPNKRSREHRRSPEMRSKERDRSRDRTRKYKRDDRKTDRRSRSKERRRRTRSRSRTRGRREDKEEKKARRDSPEIEDDPDPGKVSGIYRISKVSPGSNL